MLNDQLRMTGALTVKKNGKVVREIHNLVVAGGKELVASRLAGGGVDVSHMAIGTSTLAASVEQTALTTELDRNSLATAGGVAAANTVEFAASWGEGDGTGAVTEAGLFTAATGGTMLARTVFPVVNKTATDFITITWTITIS
mgnify:CR=1 FL=1